MKPLTVADLNPAVLNVQYAVRGELAIRAEDLRVKLEQGDALPFKRIINSNIGNPQQKGLDQPPITFVRQVSVYNESPPLAPSSRVPCRSAETCKNLPSSGFASCKARSHSLSLNL